MPNKRKHVESNTIEDRRFGQGIENSVIIGNKKKVQRKRKKIKD